MAMDKREIKLFIGTSNGKLFSINIKNGNKITKFKKHQKMVTCVLSWRS
jgi:hypothetical protein